MRPRSRRRNNSRMSSTLSANSPRREQLLTWLDSIGARELSCVNGPNKSEMRFYAAGKITFIIQIWRERPTGEISWELYAPVTASGETSETFSALERLLSNTADHEYGPHSSGGKA